MTKKLTEKIAEINYDNLVYSTDVNLLTTGIVVAANQGVLKRGTLLAKASDNKMVILGTELTKGEGDSATTETPSADCILCDEIDTTSGDVDTVGYIQGHFNVDSLIAKDSYSISEADKDLLRKKGILLSAMQG